MTGGRVGAPHGNIPVTHGDTSLTSALSALSGGFDDPMIGHCFAQLTTVLRAAVPSYCGMSITIATEAIPVTVTAPTTGDGPVVEPVTSLVIPLSAIGLAADDELVLFASVPGAFVDLAADLAHATATELVTFAVDTRLGPPPGSTVGVGGLGVINQAIGMLIGRGHTPDQARAHIAQIAAHDGHDLTAAAEGVLTGQER